MDESQPSAEAIRRAIYAQLCPFCGRGPWRVVAGHVLRKHGIPSRQLREMAGLPWSAHIASPEHSAKMAEMMRSENRVQAMAGTRVSGVAQPLSMAGRARLQAGGAVSGKRRKVAVSDHPRICARLKAGESANSIGRDFSVTGNAIRAIARRY